MNTNREVCKYLYGNSPCKMPPLLFINQALCRSPTGEPRAKALPRRPLEGRWRYEEEKQQLFLILVCYFLFYVYCTYFTWLVFTTILVEMYFYKHTRINCDVDELSVALGGDLATSFLRF